MTEEKTEATGLTEVRVQCTLAPRINLADYQNSVPCLSELALLNESEQTWHGLELRLGSVPEFFQTKVWRIDEIGPRERLRITDLDVKLDGAFLTRLTEADPATVVFQLSQSDAGEAVASCETSYPVELLPRNHWGGLACMPDMVAAFVQPNDPAVDILLKQASEVLRQAGKDGSLNGYRDGSMRAWELASAIWSAVVAKNLSYALPPASFEQRGQKVRGPTQIDESGLATCMDLSLLFCAALEQAGLNPLLVFTQGHAFAGLWLRAEEFSTVVVDDIAALRNRLKLQELVLFETTLVTHQPAPPFSLAIQAGAKHIAEDVQDTFELAVDVRRARLQRIKPLAGTQVHSASETGSGEVREVVKPIFEFAPELSDEIAEVEPPVVNAKDRLQLWQRKLLDLSLRNNLLNFKSGKKALQLEAPDPAGLEDLLSEGAVLRLLPRPDLMDGSDPRNREIHERRAQEDLRREHALDALRKREVFVALAQDALDAQLVELYRGARNALQEGGANTLFLAFGFLVWSRADKDDSKYKAPLILIPVTLERRSVRSGFTLKLHDDEPRFNPTLIEMLQQDFQLSLNGLDAELPRDDAGLHIREIWRRVASSVKDIKGWEVTEEVALSMFSFSKYLMWKDLTDRIHELRQNPVVAHLIDTPREPYARSADVAFPDPKRLDQELAPERMFCPLPVDSSQLSAVVAAVNGKDFVLIGPPGTGKSQTISNLIAQCLAEGKRVLFVSEKIAALDVVYRRLREVGLGEFCLELHSSKAKKTEVLAQLERAWDARADVDAQTWQAEAVRVGRLRDQLNTYVERLHCRFPNGLSIFGAIGEVVAGVAVPKVALAWDAPTIHTQADLQNLRELALRLGVNASEVDDLGFRDGPLSLLGHSEWSPAWQRQLIGCAQQLDLTAGTLSTAIRRYLVLLGLPASPADRHIRDAVRILATTLPQAYGRNWAFTVEPDAPRQAERLTHGRDLLERHAKLNTALSPAWDEAVLAQSTQGVQALIRWRESLTALPAPWPQDVTQELAQAIGLLERLKATRAKLSVKYQDAVETLNSHLLVRDWRAAQQAFWPASWFAKRKIKQTLLAYVTGEGEPNVGADVQTLQEIAELKAKIEQVILGPGAREVWFGLKTRIDHAQAALSFQNALAAARQQQPWMDEGWQPIESGRCGETLQRVLELMRQVRQQAQALERVALTEAQTCGLWRGLATEPEHLAAAIVFERALNSVRHSGTLDGVHEAIRRNDCGAQLAKDIKVLDMRTLVETALTELSDLNVFTSGLWRGLQTPLAELTRVLAFQSEMAKVLFTWAVTPDAEAAVRDALLHLLGRGNALLHPANEVAAAGQRYLDALEAYVSSLSPLFVAGEVSDARTVQLSAAAVDAVQAQASAVLTHEVKLRAWCAWRKVYGVAQTEGLGLLVDALEVGLLTPAQTTACFETNYCRWWLNAAVDADPVIRGFVSVEHEQRIAEFRTLDERFTDLTRALIRARLCAGLPAPDTVGRNSEWGTLRHEMSKKKRHLPLRELMVKVPGALSQLTPCLLMSPLSIAQYLSAKTPAFDVVVFDEASQVPVWDAIGAIARGRQVVMVGDPKQLPPTNFFDRAESSVAQEDVEADLESILDECIGANLPTMNLSWHYRSRHESLIAFSNHRYYSGSLVTFPSPVTHDSAVSLHHVQGCYDKGGSRTNLIEARALVADVVARLKSPGFHASGLTIGVVTFNTEQQSLIEDLLDAERRKDPSIESHFIEGELEPLFVKNLESVQGDERDIMYFSITYGPNQAGVVSMNFGPMNRDGGERRLNVAITRARHELRVFSSLKAEKIDLSRTKALGVRDLKHFLEFAERGQRALAEVTTTSLGGFESPFEQAVAQALEKRHWKVHTQIGASSFRVDLAVVHPDAPGIYLAGVECDGATYHRSATAKDRDKLREQVLRGLGWEIVRIWSTDWWIDAATTLDRTHAKLEVLLANSRAKRAQEQARLELMSPRSVPPELTEKSADAPVRLEQETDLSLDAPVCDEEPSDADAPVLYAERSVVPRVFKQPDIEADLFQMASPSTDINPAAFFDAVYDETLAHLVGQLIRDEGPILDSVLSKKIARQHGWQRTGTRIQERVSTIARHRFSTTMETVGEFFWPDAVVSSAIPFRDRLTQRAAEEICIPELVGLAQQVAKAGYTGDEAILAMGKALGWTRMHAASRPRLAMAWTQAQQS